MRHRSGRFLLMVLGALAVYAVCPVPGRDSPPVLSWLLFAAGVFAIGYAVLGLVRRQRDSDDHLGVRIEGLVGLLYVLVVFFALAYVSMATHDDQFVGIENRIDALYFTVSTIATVGYGDVHAVGSASRAAVTVQMFLDLVVIGLAARLVGPALSRKWAERPTAAEPPDDPITPAG
jgi:voltage-gated potassium channel